MKLYGVYCRHRWPVFPNHTIIYIRARKIIKIWTIQQLGQSSVSTPWVPYIKMISGKGPSQKISMALFFNYFTEIGNIADQDLCLKAIGIDIILFLIRFLHSFLLVGSSILAGWAFSKVIEGLFHAFCKALLFL